MGLAHGWRPNMFSGCILWLDADTVSGSDGDAIGTWTNKAPTGSANNVVQATGASQPLLKKGANGINGHNVIRFDGTNDYMTGSLAPGSSGMSHFFVAKTGASLKLYSSLWSIRDLAVADWAICLGNAVDGYGAGWAGPSELVLLGTIAGIATNTVFAGEAVYDKVNWELTGWRTATIPDTSFPTASPITFAIGAWVFDPTSAGEIFPGDIAEYIIFNRALSTAETAVVRKYLATKYGL